MPHNVIINNSDYSTYVYASPKSNIQILSPSIVVKIGGNNNLLFGDPKVALEGKKKKKSSKKRKSIERKDFNIEPREKDLIHSER